MHRTFTAKHLPSHIRNLCKENLPSGKFSVHQKSLYPTILITSTIVNYQNYTIHGILPQQIEESYITCVMYDSSYISYNQYFTYSCFFYSIFRTTPFTLIQDLYAFHYGLHNSQPADAQARSSCPDYVPPLDVQSVRGA